ncbi:hypothetical protein [Sorangium sp. So ce861]|uniref:hypothetical protein n=1 Tax=Sorangium sp. So ce861 TaxID=3133323 RepID=UPI003F620BA1
MALNPEAVRKRLETLKSAQGQDDLRVAAEQILDFLLTQLEELRVLANGYPRTPISSAVWTDGKALAELCDVLADALSSKGLPHQEELASRLAAGMACQVMGHYPEEIFPRVLRNSQCRERIDQLDDAIGGYEAIVADFGALELDYLLQENEELDQTGRVILTAVQHAAARLGEIQPERARQLAPFQAALQRRLVRMWTSPEGASDR